MIILRNIIYITIVIFAALVFFENDTFFMKNMNLRLNLRGWIIKFPELKIITLLFLFFCLGYFFCYYRNLKKNFKKNRELKNFKNPVKEQVINEVKEPEPAVEQIEESKPNNAEENKET